MTRTTQEEPPAERTGPAQAPTDPTGPNAGPGAAGATASSSSGHRTTSASQRQEVSELARGGGFSLAAQAANALLVSAWFALVSRSLPLSKAGGLFEAVAIVTTAALVATCGSDIGLMRVLPVARRRGYGEVRRSLLIAGVPAAVVGVVVAVGIVVVAPSLAGVLVHQASLRSPTVVQLRILAPLIPLGGLTTAFLAGSRPWGVIPSAAVQYLLIPVLRCVLFAAFLVLGMTAVLAALSWGVPLALGFVVSVAVLARILLRLRRPEPTGGPVGTPVAELARQPAGAPDPGTAASGRDTGKPDERLSTGRAARDFWAFSGPRFLEGVLSVFLWGVDIVMVGSLSSTRQAAVYTIATRWTAISILGLQAVLVAIPTRLSDLMQHSAESDARHLYRVSTWWSMAISWPAALALIVMAPFFMALFGSGYKSGDSALAVLALGVMAATLTGPCSAVLMMAGRTWVSLATTVVAVGVNIPLNVLLIPHHGALGAAIAWTGSAVVTNVVQSILLWRMFGMHPFGMALAVVVVGCVACFGAYGLAVRALLGTGVAAFCAYAVGSVLLYAGLLVAARRPLQLSELGRSIRPRRDEPEMLPA